MKLLKDALQVHGPELHQLGSVHFSNNLKNLKQATIKWANQNSLCNEQYLIKDEEDVISIYDSKGGGLLTKE